MPRLHALELVVDPDGQQQVRRSWEALSRAGLPSLADHSGASNAPHLTLVAAGQIPEPARDLAATAIGPLLPITVRTSGLALLGGSRLTLARLVDVEDEVVEAVLAIRAAVPGRQHLGWLPHVSLARRVARTDVQRAVDLLGHEDVRLSLPELRWWDPDRDAVTTLARAGGA